MILLPVIYLFAMQSVVGDIDRDNAG